MKYFNKFSWTEAIGWYGALAILFAYGLLSFEIINSSNFYYHFLNVTGASGILYISYKKKAYQPAFLNLIWILIGSFALIKIFFF